MNCQDFVATALSSLILFCFLNRYDFNPNRRLRAEIILKAKYGRDFAKGINFEAAGQFFPAWRGDVPAVY